MIGYLQGTILNKSPERILLLAGPVGYEVLLPGFVADQLQNTGQGDAVSLFIYYHQTERQPSPVLIGFTSESDKVFFQQFISVEAIGPIKAAKALSLPVDVISTAIESNDIQTLKRLKGIGTRTAHKIVATLSGRLQEFLISPGRMESSGPKPAGIMEPVFRVLMDQLGYKFAEARALIDGALARKPEINRPETLLDEIFRGQTAATPDRSGKTAD